MRLGAYGLGASWLTFSLVALAAAGCSKSGGDASGDVQPSSTPPGATPPGSAPPGATPATPPSSGGPSGPTPIPSVPIVATPQATPSAGFLTAPVPQPQGGDIVDPAAAIRLGKAFFWDAQAGSDGRIACASCHFHAGADDRRMNTIHPGPNGAFEAPFVSGPGQLYSLSTFAVDDRVGSSGVANGRFVGLATDPDDPADVCDYTDDPIYGAQRLVTGRNTPPVVGAVFNRDNFWDGRARHRFNEHTPIGAADPVYGAGPFIENASLASQSVGPPLSEVEMSCLGRSFNGPDSLGAKLLARTPLAHQLVDPTDSVLGPLSNAPGPGLRCFADRLCTYADLVLAAFGDALAANARDDFARIWGQAIQAYEATLVPDQTPYDRFLRGTGPKPAGLAEFRSVGCTACHVEPELSDATVGFAIAHPDLRNPDDTGDLGYHNIGVSPTDQDLGRWASPGGRNSDSVFNKGAFKTPQLRNVKLTAPYMHNGSIATLGEVVAFYDNPRFQLQNAASLAGAMGQLSQVGGNSVALQSFLRDGLTDCRVEHELAPFDHPALVVPDGPALQARGAAGDGSVCP